MFVWAPIPEPFVHLGSLEFAKLLMQESQLAVSPGIGFGPLGEGFVRFSLIENDERVRAATKRVGTFLRKHDMLLAGARTPVHV
jgi:alanine-synthesizing transaminase